jgi:hypothetical protein
MKKLIPLIAIVIFAYYASQETQVIDRPAVSASAFASQIGKTFARTDSGAQVSGNGRVSRILSDDKDGSRHQRFVLDMPSGQTVLIAHNIDLAPRISGLSEGDDVFFHGEYEWNTEGGIVHWTHRDPNGRHVGGWLKHNGQRYD